MARIGGARVGMAPPVFTRKQSAPKPELAGEEITLISLKHGEASISDNGTFFPQSAV
jgi:hypothetical protein